MGRITILAIALTIHMREAGNEVVSLRPSIPANRYNPCIRQRPQAVVIIDRGRGIS